MAMIYVSDPTAEELRAVAESEDRRVSDIVRRILRDYLDKRRDSQQQDRKTEPQPIA